MLYSEQLSHYSQAGMTLRRVDVESICYPFKLLQFETIGNIDTTEGELVSKEAWHMPW